MKVGFFFNQPVWFDGEHYTSNYINLLPFFFELGSFVDQFTLLTPVKYSATQRGRYTLSPAGTRIIALPFYVGEQGVVRKFPQIVAATIRLSLNHISEWDLVGCTSPSLASSLITAFATEQERPLFHLVRGNKLATLNNIYPGGPKGLFFGHVVRLFDAVTRRSIDNGAAAFVVGAGLMPLYKRHQSSKVWSFAPVLSPEFVGQPRRPSGPCSRPHTIIYVGRLSAEKGLFDLLDAMSLLHTQEPGGYSLLLLGDGPDRARLEQRVEELALGHVARFLGFVAHGEALVAAYRKACLSVLPSYTEGIPTGLVEAMSLGTPVVATRVGGIPDLLRHGDAGMLVDPGQPLQLADAIRLLTGDQSIQARLVTGGYEQAMLHTPEAQRAVFLSGLAELAKNGRAASRREIDGATRRVAHDG